MASRRRLGNMAETYLKFMLQQRAQEQQYDLQARNQAALAKLQGEIGAQQESEKALFGDLSKDPDLAHRLLTAGRNKVAGQDIAPFAETNWAPESQMVSGAKTLADLPSGQALLQNRLGRSSIPIRDLNGITSLLNARQSQEDALAKAAPAKVEDVSPETGLKREQYLDPRTLSGQTFSKEPTPQQAGLNAGLQQKALYETPGLTDAEIFQKNAIEKGTRGERVRTAGAESSARGYAQESGSLKAKKENLPFLQQLAEINRAPLQGELLAAGRMQPLISADARMRQMENNGGGLTFGATTAVGNPAIANNFMTKKFYGKDDLMYAQDATEFVNIAGQMISGVAVRADERDNFYGAMIPNREDPPELKKQKQDARQTFIQIGQASAGRAKGEAGMMIGRAIKAGSMPATVLQTLQLDPEVLMGVQEGLK